MIEFKDLHSKTILLTGAFGHVGRVVARGFAEQGSRLILIDRLSEYDRDFIAELESTPADVYYFEVDFESSISRKQLIQTILKDFQVIDVLINNAGFVGTRELKGWATSFEEQSIETWNRALEVNLSAPFELIQGLIQPLGKSPAASIVNVASIYGFLAPNWDLYLDTNMGNPAAYAASKGGLIQLTKWLSTTLAPNIRVNSVSPGGIFRDQEKAFVLKYVEKTPMRRLAVEVDVANYILFLASNASSYVTGQNHIVDGGFSVW